MANKVNNSSGKQNLFESFQKKIISALATAVSMILEDPEGGIDQEILTKYLCDVGKLLTVFHQQSVARKLFITPLLNKSVKFTVEATDEWLYGNKFAE